MAKRYASKSAIGNLTAPTNQGTNSWTVYNERRVFYTVPQGCIAKVCNVTLNNPEITSDTAQNVTTITNAKIEVWASNGTDDVKLFNASTSAVNMGVYLNSGDSLLIVQHLGSASRTPSESDVVSPASAYVSLIEEYND